MSDLIRVGFVGAGNNTRLRHIPGFQAIEGVELAAVVNSSAESTEAVAKEYGISRTFENWQQLVESSDVDAVMIGTWPNLHCEVTCAALAAGKHVLTEARMARNLGEAKQMLLAAKNAPDLVAQIVPSPFGLESGPAIAEMIKTHYLGDLREIVVLGANDQFWDYSQELHPRQDAEQSGKNVLALGILHETLMRWASEPVQVFAQSELFEPTRPIPDESRYANVTVPDSLQVLAQLKGGARCIYHLSGVALFGPGLQIHLYGSRGTIKVNFINGKEEVVYGRVGDGQLTVMEIPDEEKGAWNVEAEFIDAIRTGKKPTLTDFATGVSYMEFVEAVAQSAADNAPVSLPLG